jgi:hypothetical protein
MRWLLVSMSALVVSSCDTVSQRIWNCSSQPIGVTKVLETGARVIDTIPARKYIGTMASGVQIDALEQDGRAIWRSRRNLWVRAEWSRGLAASADEICGRGKKVIVAEEF